MTPAEASLKGVDRPPAIKERTTKDDGSEENARWTHRQHAEAKRRCHAAKGFQHGTIARTCEPETWQATGFSLR